MNRQKLVTKIFIYVLLICMSLVYLVPLYWMVSTSFKLTEDIAKYPPDIIPNPLTFGNYPDAINRVPFFTFLKNTLTIVAASLVGTLLSCSLVAYGFSRINWKGRDIVFILVLATMMLPYQVTMVPVYLVMKTLGWINTLYPLTVPTFFGSAFNIFLLRQFFMTIPIELSEAAKIDGANEFYIYSRLILPLTRPALTAVAIFTLLNSWNDFLAPLIYLNDESLYTLSLGLQYFRTSFGVEMGSMMAMATIMTLPIIAIFFFCQRYFIQGITLTGIKG